jgi:hypothetical protein
MVVPDAVGGCPVNGDPGAVPKDNPHHQIGGDDVCGNAKSVLDDHDVGELPQPD